MILSHTKDGSADDGMSLSPYAISELPDQSWGSLPLTFLSKQDVLFTQDTLRSPVTWNQNHSNSCLASVISHSPCALWVGIVFIPISQQKELNLRECNLLKVTQVNNCRAQSEIWHYLDPKSMLLTHL